MKIYLTILWFYLAFNDLNPLIGRDNVSFNIYFITCSKHKTDQCLHSYFYDRWLIFVTNISSTK